LQDISLSYKQKKLEILEKHSTSQETITSFTDSSIVNSAQAKEKFRESREKTADEKISRMNRIIKTNLQKMLNVIVIANIAAAAATISQAAAQLFSSTFAIVNNRQRR
jgi:flagellin-specific chaperone FliS